MPSDQKYATSREVWAARERALWSAYRSARSIANRNALGEFYLPCIKAWIGRFCAARGLESLYHELVAAAMVRLLTKAIPAFEPSRRLKFRTYAGQHIRGAAIDYLREMDDGSRTMRNFTSRRLKAAARFSQEHGRQPTDAELAEAMGVEESELWSWRNVKHRAYHDVDEARLLTLEELLPAGPTKLPDEGFFDQLTAGVDPDTRVAIRLYFWHGVTMARIGEVLGLSESRISQAVSAGLRFMRRHRDRIRSFDLLAVPPSQRAPRGVEVA